MAEASVIHQKTSNLVWTLNIINIIDKNIQLIQMQYKYSNLAGVVVDGGVLLRRERRRGRRLLHGVTWIGCWIFNAAENSPEATVQSHHI